jgi:hypothetical protein
MRRIVLLLAIGAAAMILMPSCGTEQKKDTSANAEEKDSTDTIQDTIDEEGDIEDSLKDSTVATEEEGGGTTKTTIPDTIDEPEGKTQPQTP